MVYVGFLWFPPPFFPRPRRPAALAGALMLLRQQLMRAAGEAAQRGVLPAAGATRLGLLGALMRGDGRCRFYSRGKCGCWDDFGWFWPDHCPMG
jgi:hypothetical protein